MAEYNEVIGREKFRKIIPEELVTRFLNLTLPKLTTIELKRTVLSSRDPDDNYLLATSVETKADYLITGDDDLLIIGQIGKTKIVKMSDFLSLTVK